MLEYGRNNNKLFGGNVKSIYKDSIKKLKKQIKKQIILNPVENLPFKTIKYDTRIFQGLYVSDKNKTEIAEFNSKISFSGRRNINKLVLQIYDEWSHVLKAKKISLRFLSGLHAHMVLFMSIGNIGDSVALLPEIAGGHYATKNILTRLGYNVLELIADNKNYKINIEESINLINIHKPKFLFIDRSEGIFYEDFTELCKKIDCYKIFDASQYLSHILNGEYISPFEMGFDMILSTLHKNFPGPQKALICTNNEQIEWYNLTKGTSEFVSSLHIQSLLESGLALIEFLKNKKYTINMLENSKIITDYLLKYQVPVVTTPFTPKTQHIWIKFETKEKAFEFYKNLEKINILVNFRKLPYNLGYGIRLGTAASTLCGLTPKLAEKLADIIKDTYYYGYNYNHIKFIKKIAKKLY